MTNELRTVLFHVRDRLIQVRQTLLQDDAAATSQPMTIGEALRLLKEAINLELARPWQARKAACSNIERAERGKKALRAYLEAKHESFDNTSRQVPELIADLLHLTMAIDRNPEAVEMNLRKAREFFTRESGKIERKIQDKVGRKPMSEGDSLEAIVASQSNP